jgi:3',5'-cyclic-nucleotide phosphodiesterase
MPIDNTPLTLTAYTLSHSNPYKSTAFLIGSKDNFLLYLGDTGADSTEHSQQLGKLWDAVAPLIKQKKLKAIFIETSFDNSQPSKSLFGHLTPALLMQEMNDLSKRTGKQALQQVSVVITHEKPGNNREQIIRQELKANNPLRLKLVFPQQAVALSF